MTKNSTNFHHIFHLKWLQYVKHRGSLYIWFENLGINCLWSSKKIFRCEIRFITCASVYYLNVLLEFYLELSMMVLSLWAMVNTVQFENSLRIVFCMSSSVLWSTEAVASSSIKIFVFRSRARAKHTSWRWPTLFFKANKNSFERCVFLIRLCRNLYINKQQILISRQKTCKKKKKTRKNWKAKLFNFLHFF